MVGVVVELVHDDVVHRGVRAVAEGDVGEDFRGAADDRGVVVDGGVAGDHADVFRAEDVAEGEEFLVGECLDRDGVVGAAALAEGFELEGEGDQRFPGAGGGVEDDVVAGEELEDGFFLVVVGLGAGGGEVVEEGVEDVVRGGVFGEILAAERGGHGGRLEEEEFTAKTQRTRRGAKFQEIWSLSEEILDSLERPRPRSHGIMAFFHVARGGRRRCKRERCPNRGPIFSAK